MRLLPHGQYISISLIRSSLVNAQMAELVDAHGSGPCAARCGGSSPLLGTSTCLQQSIHVYITLKKHEVTIIHVSASCIRTSIPVHRHLSFRGASFRVSLIFDVFDTPNMLSDTRLRALKPKEKAYRVTIILKGEYRGLPV